MHNVLGFTTILATLTGAFGASLPSPQHVKRDVNYVFNIANADASPDGFVRSAALVNGQFHGTTIFGNKGDTLNVQVNNQLTDPSMRRSTSIHWHGILQRRNNYQDGPAFVTQCPIAPNATYTYSMPLSEAGTYWYHSHLSTQYIDGIRGVIVVYDPSDPHANLYDVDDENTIITLADWWHTPGIEATEAWLSSTNTGGIESVPDSGLINGVGRYVGGPALDWSRINVVQGQSYRFRIVNTSGIARFRFAIQGHTLTAIEADGVNHVPITGNYIDVYPGQRYSVVVTADQAVDNYWITAPMTIRNSNTNANLDVNSVFAVLHYAGAADADPAGTPPTASGTQILEANMVPLENPGVTGSDPADKVFNLAFTRQTEASGLNFKINGNQYIPPTLPTLLQVLSGADDNSDFGVNENSFVIDKDDIVEINISGAPGHPFHLHGHFFDVIQSATGSVNYVNPPRRDVVATRAGGNVTIRFKADNPGPWILHCHIDMHLDAGLAAVFVEAPPETVTGDLSVVPSAEWQQLCDTYNALPTELQ